MGAVQRQPARILKTFPGSCQLNVDYFYDEGIRIRKNKSNALFWYMKKDKRQAARCCRKLLNSKNVTELTKEQAIRALNELET